MTDNWPHEPVQRQIANLLASALALSLRAERTPGADERQRKLYELVVDYRATVEEIKKPRLSTGPSH